VAQCAIHVMQLHVACWQILLQKSFWGENFSGPLMRFARLDMRATSFRAKTITVLRIAATEDCSGGVS
jgi:hypothetical protein